MRVMLASLLVLPFLKLAASAVSAGAGVPGGLFTPSLFYGAALGGAAGLLLLGLLPWAALPAARGCSTSPIPRAASCSSWSRS